MRPTVAAALGILALLIATSLFVPGIGRAGGVAPAQSAVPAASSMTIATTTSYGAHQSVYYSGLNSGRVYFAVTDSSTDTSAVVSIYDHNASRDGLGSSATIPVHNFTVNFRAGGNYSYQWNIFYQIPVTLVYGGQWSIGVKAAVGGNATQNFTVTTYGVLSAITPRATLPAENVSTAILLVNSANNAPYTAATGVVITGSYSTTSATIATLPSTPVNLGALVSGYYNFTVPSDASGTLSLTIYANTSSGGYNTSETATQFLTVGHLSPPSVTLSSCPTGCPTTSFAAGAPVYVTANELISGLSGYPARGVDVSFKFEKGSSFVTPPGNVPTTLTTNDQGSVSLSFLASTSVFSTSMTNTVVVTVTDPNDPALTSQTTNASFSIYRVTTLPSVLVTWDSSEYYSGSTATFQWALGGQNSSVTQGWSGSYWVVEGSFGSSFLQIGRMAAGETSGSVSVAIPATYLGEIIAYAYASNATNSVGGSANSDSEAGTILLTPNEAYYLPGDTVSISIGTNGAALSGATLWATVVDGSGNWILNSAVSGGSVSISVPSNSPPTRYTVTVSAETATLGTIANASLTVYEASGVDLNLGITTPSNYLDGSYQPGETVTVSYSFTARGTASLPQTYSIQLTPTTASGSGYSTTSVAVSGASGSFQYTIPKDAANGLLLVQASATLGGPNCVSFCHTGNVFTASVNGNPAALSYQFGNSGITLGAVIAILVLLVLALIVFVMVRRRRMGGRPMMMRPESSSSPPASSPGGEGPSHPGSSGGGSPPPSSP